MTNSIIYNRNTVKKVRTVPVGQAFICDEQLCMKISPETPNTVNLANGRCYDLHPECEVETVDLEIVVK